MIYFMQPVGGGPVKIGYSVDVEERRKTLEFHYRKPLVVLATLPGNQEEEHALHLRFAHLRLKETEQFRPEDDLMEFVGRALLVVPDPTVREAIKPVYHAVRLDLRPEDSKELSRIAGSLGMSRSSYARMAVLDRRW